jgi:hypothetical protein
MKKIEEEWKTIEEFPDYEISNFGNCRRKKRGKVAMKQLMKRRPNKEGRSDFYNLRKCEDGRIVATARSCGILVARHFVDNPNGYPYLSYKDGDVNNHFYMNLEWIKIRHLPTCKKKTFEKEKQLMLIEEHIDFVIRLKDAILNNSIPEFVYSPQITEKCRFCLKMATKNGLKQEVFDECLSYIQECITDYLLRGYAIVSFRSYVNFYFRKFINLYSKQLKTIEIDERRM